jgi:hypothetical protein
MDALFEAQSHKICLYRKRRQSRITIGARSGHYEYYPLCTREWVADENDRYGHSEHFTTSQHEVTCIECLEYLIPKKQAELDKMNASLEKARNERSSHAHD